MDTLSPTQEDRNFPSRSQTPSYEHRPPPPLPPLPDRTSYVKNPKQALIADQFPLLLEKSKEELNDLLHNQVVFDSFFEELERVKSTRGVQEELRAANEMLARRNLAREQELIQLRQSIRDQQTQLGELHEEFQDKLKVQQDALHRFSPSLLLSKLKSEVQSSDEVSEQMASSFLDGGLGNDLFLKHFREVRKVYHLRNAKVESVGRNPGILGP